MEKSRITVRFEPESRALRGADDGKHKAGQSRPERRGIVIALRPDEYAALDEPRAGHEEGEEAQQGRGGEAAAGSKKQRSSDMKGRLDPDYPYDYGAWNHSAAAEADELERLIRDADDHDEPHQQAAYQQLLEEMDPETGYWNDGKDRRQPFSDESRGVFHRSAAPSSVPFWKMAGSVASAVATGILFGMLLMNFFAGGEQTAVTLPQETEGPTEGVDVVLPEAGTPEDSNAGNGIDAADELDAALATVDIPERRMWLLQYGKFETLDNARTMAGSIRERGLAATIEEADGFYVYAGVAADRDAALRTGVKLQNEGLEVYVKPYALPPVSQVRWEDGSAEALSDYLARGSGLLRMIGGLTLVHIEGDPVAPEPSSLEKLRGEHLALQELQPAALGGLPAEAQPMLERMDVAAREAVTAVEEYGARPNHAYLWSAQSALMDYVVAEKQLLTTIAMK